MLEDISLAKGVRLVSPIRTYTILKTVGKGGFGITYQVYGVVTDGNISTPIKYAVKEHFINECCSRDADGQSVKYYPQNAEKVENARKDFINEAECLKRICLHHPNIVKVNEVFEANNTAYYVMEFVDGPNLTEYISKHGRLSSSEALAIIRPIVNAVGYLHDSRITHLDIKPDNILLSTDYDDNLVPILIDFGLARYYSDDSDHPALQSAGFTGGFAPPEQFMGIRRFSPTADVYSLGATLFFALTGHKPLDEGVTPEWIKEQLPDDVPASLCDVIAAAMSRSKNDRPSDASALATCLADVEKPAATPQRKGFVFDARKGKRVSAPARATESQESQATVLNIPQPQTPVTPQATAKPTSKAPVETKPTNKVPVPPITSEPQDEKTVILTTPTPEKTKKANIDNRPANEAVSPITAPPVSIDDTMTGTASVAPPRSKKGILIAIVAAVIVLCGVGGWFLYTSDSTSEPKIFYAGNLTISTVPSSVDVAVKYNGRDGFVNATDWLEASASDRNMVDVKGVSVNIPSVTGRFIIDCEPSDASDWNDLISGGVKALTKEEAIALSAAGKLNIARLIKSINPSFDTNAIYWTGATTEDDPQADNAYTVDFNYDHIATVADKKHSYKILTAKH